jgi:hypothetical protein
MTAHALRQKLTFDASRVRSYHVRLAVSCREAARLHPEYRGHLRTKMRTHALSALARPGVSFSA